MIFAVHGDAVSAGQSPIRLVMKDPQAAADSRSSAGNQHDARNLGMPAGGKARGRAYASAAEGQPYAEPGLLDAISHAIRPVCARTDSAI